MQPRLPLLRLSALGIATSLALAAGTASAAGLVLDSGLRSQQPYDGFIVKYRDGSAERSSPRLLQDSLQGALTRAAGSMRALSAPRLLATRRLAVGADLVRFDRKLGQQDAQALMRAIASDPNVEYVEPNLILQASLTPNDTRYGEQWHYFEATGGLNLPAAWDRARGSGIVVAVLDTGITPHSDLSANVIAGYDFVSDAAAARDGNGRDSNPNDEGDWCEWFECPQIVPTNSSWHGTHVAGTIAAVTNNAKGVAGVAFNAKVQPVRVLGRGGGSLADIADAMVWASGGSVTGVPANPTPAEVINMSLGGQAACDGTMQTAVTSAVNRGTVVVVAAGNSNADASGFTPAGCNGVITVAATNRAGGRASYSNYGSTIEVSAPGGDGQSGSNVLSTLNSGTKTQAAESYALYAGTSMASPHVAGVVALMQSVAVNTPAQVVSILKSTARPLPGPCSEGCGAGIVNAAAAVAAVGGGTPGNTAPSAAFSFAANGLSVAFTDKSSDSDGSVVSRSWKFGDGSTSTATNPSHTYAAAGTYTVTLTVKDDDGASSSVSKSVAVSGGGGGLFANETDYAINDFATVSSPITVSGVSGNAPSDLVVAVDIRHTYIGDLRVDLVAPDGSVYTLHNHTGSGTDNIIRSYTVNASSEVANGTWKLRVNDNAFFDTGRINRWSLQF